MRYRQVFDIITARLLQAVKTARSRREPWAVSQFQRERDRTRRILIWLELALFGELARAQAIIGGEATLPLDPIAFDRLVRWADQQAEQDPSAAWVLEVLYLLSNVQHAIRAYLREGDYLITGTPDPERIARERGALTGYRDASHNELCAPTPPVELIPQAKPNAPSA